MDWRVVETAVASNSLVETIVIILIKDRQNWTKRYSESLKRLYEDLSKAEVQRRT
jgi:hypothetical protein